MKFKNSSARYPSSMAQSRESPSQITQSAGSPDEFGVFDIQVSVGEG